MSDDAIAKFSQEMVREVEEALAGDESFSEEIFTRMILERLEEAGHMEGTFPLYQQGRVKNSIYRIDGYAFDEERSRLELFTTVYMEDLSPFRLSAAEVSKAF